MDDNDSDDDDRLQDAQATDNQRSDTDCEMRSVRGSPIQARNLGNDQVSPEDPSDLEPHSELDLDSESDFELDPNVEGMFRSLFIW